MTGVHLLIFAILLAGTAPRLLRRATWVYASPRLGIAAWYGVLVALAVSVFGAGLAWVAPWEGADSKACLAVRWCLQAARGAYGATGRVILATLGLAAAALTVRAIMTGVRVTRAAKARRDRHRDMLTLAGRRDTELDATVIDHPRPAAYVVAGQPRCVVVTTGALDVLSADELAAVLAHERAHAFGRHDLLIDGVRLLECAFPKVLLLTTARAQLARLVEIRADDVATSRHPRISLARALVTMATANAATPVGALAASGGDATERLHRLLTPPTPLHRVHRMLITAAIVTLIAAPLLLLVGVHFFPILGMCPVHLG